MAVNMEGFVEVETGVSQKFRRMWVKEGPVLRVEFHNRKGPELEGSLCDYNVTDEVVNEIKRLSQSIGEGSVGSYFHREVVSKTTCVYVRQAE